MPKIEQVLPKYQQIAGYIRDQIARGDLRPGDEVPSEREIASSWEVARPTAARALEWLRAQGLVVSRQGSGTYVRDQSSAPRARERYDRARSTGTMYGPDESIELLSAEVVDGPSHILETLGLKGSDKVIRRVRLLRSDGEPLEVSISWLAAELADEAPGLLRLERLRGGVAGYVGDQTGRRPAYARDQVESRFATFEECELLALTDPSPVLAYRSVVYSDDDRALCCDESTYPPGMWTLAQEYQLG